MTDAERLQAARVYISKALSRMGTIVTAQEYERAVQQAAEALPPFTRIRTTTPGEG
jgi:hypothetical protein